MNRISRRWILALTLSLGSWAAHGADAPAKAADPVIVTLDTTDGRIVLELDAQHAPSSVRNFVQYVKDGFYDQTIFHRVIPGFMAQGGGYTGGLVRKQTRGPIGPDSSNGLHNSRGTIAMARTSDPNSATSQFFINVADNGMLDFPSRDGTGYTVFGKVIEGMEAVDKIVNEPSRAQGYEFQNLPIQPVFIQKAHIGR